MGEDQACRVQRLPKEAVISWCSVAQGWQGPVTAESLACLIQKPGAGLRQDLGMGQIQAGV